jgi:hypothetical protein
VPCLLALPRGLLLQLEARRSSGCAGSAGADSGEHTAHSKAAAATMAANQNLFPDLHHKMSKKIAQLTKVIYHLNSKNEEHNDDLTSLSDAYETEIDGVRRSPSSLSSTFLHAAWQPARSQVRRPPLRSACCFAWCGLCAGCWPLLYDMSQRVHEVLSAVCCGHLPVCVLVGCAACSRGMLLMHSGFAL